MLRDLRTKKRVKLTALLPPAPDAPPPPSLKKSKASPEGDDEPWLRWGIQRRARCVKVSPADARPAPPRPAARPQSEPRKRKVKRVEPLELTVFGLKPEQFAAAKAKHDGNEVAAAAAAKRSRGEGRRVESSPRAERGRRCDTVSELRRLMECEASLFSARLTCEEIAEDYTKIMGRGPPSRPNKRPTDQKAKKKKKRKEEDTLFPGLAFLNRA